METINGGVTSPQGFRAAGVAAGIKYENRKDLALVCSDAPAVAAGVFTTNVVKAAPVLWDMGIVDYGKTVRAAVINAGIANACTGKDGLAACEKTARLVAQALDIDEREVLVCSTGVIGMPLPLERIEGGVAKLASRLSSDESAGTDAATAIMTTDTVAKETAVRLMIGNRPVTIGGMAKGSGMIHPNMATLLALITTDATIDKELLTEAVNEVTQATFNMISVDGDTSTNDTFLALANGRAGNPAISEESDDYRLFKDALYLVCVTLSKKLAGDGEGATTLIEVEVKGASSETDARALARSVASSNLVKAAVFGRDANWGRILCALGYAGSPFDPDAVSLSFSGAAKRIKIYENGAILAYDESEASELLKEKEIKIEVTLNMGEASARAWGCDLSYDYVKINADYRS